MKRKIVLMMLVTAVLSSSAFAWDIAIDNAGFETTLLAEGAYDFEVPDWDSFGPTPAAGSWNPDADGAVFYGYGGVAPEGLNVVWI